MTRGAPDASTDREVTSRRVLRERAERETMDDGAPTSAPLSIELHDLRVHQIELEMQNEELRRAGVELDASRARYFDLYDLAPVGYVTLDERGTIVQANRPPPNCWARNAMPWSGVLRAASSS